LKAISRSSAVVLLAALLVVCASAFTLLLWPGKAQAAGYVVTLTSDTLPNGVAGELRWAINSANSTTAPAATWYLAEGSTGGDFETFVLVQNPGASDVSVDLTFMTSSGEQPGPQDYNIAAGSRHTFKVNDYVTDWDVSTVVTAYGGDVICERAMYGGNRTWAHDSIGYSP
jgi:hypothetical protein